jgi:hypothetical protein
MFKVINYALLVEGPVHATDTEMNIFVELWHVYLASLGVALPAAVVPIHKPHLVAMDPSLPKMSGASEPLDHLLARVIDEHKIESVVIAWDLTPPWDPDAEEDRYCRWNETKKLYGHLAESEVLADEWRASCRVRADELAARDQPGDRGSAFTLREYGVVAICMEPEFEGLLAQDDGQIMRALGLPRRPANYWPKSWTASGQNPKTLLQKAVVAARKYRPKTAPTKRIRGDMWTAKHAWGLHFLRALLQHKRSLVDDHPLSVRITETLR